MEQHRCPACGDRGYVGNDLICGSCGTRLALAGNQLELAPTRATNPWPWIAAVLIGILMGAAARWLKPIPAVASAPRIDVAFVIDTTGSMDDEIEVVKTQVRNMMERVQNGNPRPQVRFGMVLFRDHGDAYVTRVLPFSEDVEALARQLQGVTAEGGGDVPEAVSEALHVAINDLEWDPSQNTGKMLVLIGDAAPHTDYGNFDYRQELAAARKKGIKLHAWGCSGIVESGQNEFQEMAAIGGGQFQFLTYRQQVVKADGTSASVVFEGDKAYEVEKGADWKAGSVRIGKKATPLPAASYSAPTAYGSGSFKTKDYRSAGGGLENNLDRALTEQVMDEARARGVAY